MRTASCAARSANGLPGGRCTAAWSTQRGVQRPCIVSTSARPGRAICLPTGMFGPFLFYRPAPPRARASERPGVRVRASRRSPVSTASCPDRVGAGRCVPVPPAHCLARTRAGRIARHTDFRGSRRLLGTCAAFERSAAAAMRLSPHSAERIPCLARLLARTTDVTASVRPTAAFVNVGHAYAHLFMLLYPTVVLALEGTWGLGYAELLPLGVAGYFLFGIGSLPAGWLADRWNSARLMVMFFLGTGAASVLTGLALGPWSLALGLTLIGLFASIYHPVAIAWLVGADDRPGRALGINGIYGAAGISGAALVAGFLADLISWRAAFIVPGVVCLVTGAWFALRLIAGKVVMERHSYRQDGDPAERRRGAPRPVHAAGRDPVHRSDLSDDVGGHAQAVPGAAGGRHRHGRACRRHPSLRGLCRLRIRPVCRRHPRRSL